MALPPFAFRRRTGDSPEIQAARKLLAAAANGIPTIHGPLNRVLLALGLGLSRAETPAEKIARIQSAIDRHDFERQHTESRQPGLGDRLASALKRGLAGSRGKPGPRR